MIQFSSLRGGYADEAIQRSDWIATLPLVARNDAFYDHFRELGYIPSMDPRLCGDDDG